MRAPRPGAAAATARGRDRTAIFVATWIVGLVSPRSTCDSIGALTPVLPREVTQRAALRLAQPSDPLADGVSLSWLYGITYIRTSSRPRQTSDEHRPHLVARRSAVSARSMSRGVLEVIRALLTRAPRHVVAGHPGPPRRAVRDASRRMAEILACPRTAASDPDVYARSVACLCLMPLSAAGGSVGGGRPRRTIASAPVTPHAARSRSYPRREAGARSACAHRTDVRRPRIASSRPDGGLRDGELLRRDR